ncbi:SPOR domain-containing protein [Silicimonas sp. MF1-12-2]|uniref:SPOR domain-containing protein n=1 Tax=Silicimonas sp. MF1-12-2 TaxID=3384793 RepID=UPI0039B636B4
MAAFNYDDYGDSRFGGSLTAALNWAGAFLSVVLIAGLATWGWKLWVRDVSGVPVVRALEGPMRVAPEDPGGLASEYQGLSVNRIAEERTEENLADRVVLAPQPSILNEEEDLAMAELQPMAELAPPPLVDAPMSIETTEASVMATEADEGEGEAVPLVASETLAVEEETVAEPDRSGTDLAVALALGLADEAEDAQPAVLTVEAAPGVPVVTPRPLIRPENLQAVSYMPSATGGASEIDPSTIPAGTRLVQLGAFGSAEIARAEWDKANAQFGNYMTGKELVIQEAQTGGRTFWRLRAMGFEDLADARRFCSVLVSDGANCIPVVQE